jgi:hypothetical protein
MSQVQTENPVRLEWNEHNGLLKFQPYWISCPDCGEMASYTVADGVIECISVPCRLKRFKFGRSVKF